ncbi:MAG: hypothetical protein GY847_37355 [Proteobacteria bacterium]|nr:hypothetical protein [Pseudomonadota bacterium]
MRIRARAIISPHFPNADPFTALGVGARHAVPLLVLRCGRLGAWKKREALSHILIMALVCGCNGTNKESPDAGADSESSSPCPWDDDDEYAQAGELSVENPVEGFLCPKGDQDWYEFTIPDGYDILTVELSIEAPVSPIDPTYAIWTAGAEDPLIAPKSDESAAPSEPIKIVHGLESGEYLIVVKDRANDAEDVRHPYRLSVSIANDMDSNEPNNSDAQATKSSATPMKGYISYRGDEDWYEIESQERSVANVSLTMPKGGIEPAYRIVDPNGDVMISNANEAGKREATSLSYLQALQSAGSYFVVISDDDNIDYDLETPYALEVSLEQDPDQNEANDHPSEATELSSLTCDNDWSDWINSEGYIGSSGDIDWYKINVDNCGRGVIEIDISFGSQKSLPEDLQASVRLVRNVDEEPCTVDQDCQKLSTKRCEIDETCSQYGNNCLSEGVCAGTGVCLPTGQCGAALCSESAPLTITNPNNPLEQITNPERGKVLLSAPLFGLSPVYIAVEDYHGDAHSLDHAYTIRTRVRTDPDIREPSEVYAAGPADIDDEISAQTAVAKEVTVHDCTQETDGGLSCCGEDTWVEGYLSYKHDQDWYAYSHPCPQEDCMVRVLFEFDQGPVDFYMQIFRSTVPWFDNLSDTVEQDTQAAKSGYFGGLEADDYCFYAYRGHTGDPFWYYLVMRDTIFISEVREEDGTWDQSAEQAYRFCIEKVADGCHEPPCKNYDEGCGAPSSK